MRTAASGSRAHLCADGSQVDAQKNIFPPEHAGPIFPDRVRVLRPAHSLDRLLLGRLVAAVDRKIFGPWRLHPSLPGLSPISRTDLLHHHKPHPPESALLADLCAADPLPRRTRIFFHARSDLAALEAPGSRRFAALHRLPRRQPNVPAPPSSQPELHALS